MEDNQEVKLAENPENKPEENAAEVKEPDNKNNNLVLIEKPDFSEDYAVKIEDSRKELFAAYNKSRKISNIITVAVLVVAVGAMLLITQKNALCTILGWSLAGLTVVGMIVYYLVNRNKFPDRTKKYIRELTVMLNEQTFANEKFTECKSNFDEKMDVSEIVGDSVYENIGQISSRNIVRGKFNGKEFAYGEIALGKMNATRKDGPLFVGKYISLPNKLQMKGRCIINLKRDQEPLDLPTKIGDLDVLKDEDGVVIYGMKDFDYNAVLGTKFISDLKKLAPSEHIINTNVVVWAGRTAAYISYDDATMALPFDKPFSEKVNRTANENVLDLFNAFNEIGK